MPNSVAYFALFSWPVVVFVLFRIMPRAQALIWSILGGYLLLPPDFGINFPMLPTIDKTLVPALSAAVMCMLVPGASVRRRKVEGTRDGPSPAASYASAFSRRRPHGPTGKTPSGGKESQTTRRRLAIWIEGILLLLLVATPFLTVMQNSEPYSVGGRVLPGLRLYDAFAMILSALVAILPYLLARRYLAHPDQHVFLLRGLCLAGLLYSLPVLFEVRMSPQLSKMLYGYLAQPFANTMRDGGFRPPVFLHAGLWLAIFMSMTTIAAVVLWRHERHRITWLFAGSWLLGTLVLCRSLGALAIAIVVLPFVVFTPKRIQLAVASILALVLLLYPLLRGIDLVPVNSMVALARTVSVHRAESLEFRLENEDILLAHANDKPLAGWGGFGRSRVFDPVTGRDLSVTDGMWIIIVGVSGWLGYVAQIGLLTIPIVLLTFNRRRLTISVATSGLCLILVANLLDMIPNATLTPITWLIAGALIGRCNSGPETPNSPKRTGRTRENRPAAVTPEKGTVSTRSRSG